MPSPKPTRTRKPKNAQPSAKPRPKTPSAFEKAMQDMRQTPGEFPNVSVRWLLGAAAFAREW